MMIGGKQILIGAGGLIVLGVIGVFASTGPTADVENRILDAQEGEPLEDEAEEVTLDTIELAEPEEPDADEMVEPETPKAVESPSGEAPLVIVETTVEPDVEGIVDQVIEKEITEDSVKLRFKQNIDTNESVSTSTRIKVDTGGKEL